MSFSKLSHLPPNNNWGYTKDLDKEKPFLLPPNERVKLKTKNILLSINKKQIA